jgi:hypothetical protein
MSAFSTTIFNNEPMMGEINRGVEKLQTRIIYPRATRYRLQATPSSQTLSLRSK